MNKIKVFAPATISNVGCGFDTIGFAIHQPGDIVELSLKNDGIVKIKNITGDGGVLPYDIKKNTASQKIGLSAKYKDIIIFKYLLITLSDVKLIKIFFTDSLDY